MMVKVCGITHRADAEFAAAAGASALGFVFAPSSPRCVTPAEARALGEGLQVLRVGVFVAEDAARVRAVAAEAALDVVQLYGGETPAGLRVWRACRVTDALPAPPADAEAAVYDGPASGVPFAWSLLRGAAGRFVLAGGLDAANVAAAVRAVRPWGVDASSRLEREPGRKDPEKVRAFIEAARNA
jgi:phosphoribosylanthranilate isomerase